MSTKYFFVIAFLVIVILQLPAQRRNVVTVLGPSEVPRISVITAGGKIKSIDPEKIILIQRNEVNSEKNWNVKVLEYDSNCKTFSENYYRSTAKKIADKSGIEFIESHRGIYLNINLLDKIYAIKTKNKIYFNVDYEVDLNNIPNIQNRTGALIINNETGYFPVSKRNLQSVLKKIPPQKFNEVEIISHPMFKINDKIGMNLDHLPAIQNEYSTKSSSTFSKGGSALFVIGVIFEIIRIFEEDKAMQENIHSTNGYSNQEIPETSSFPIDFGLIGIIFLLLVYWKFDLQ